MERTITPELGNFAMTLQAQSGLVLAGIAGVRRTMAFMTGNTIHFLDRLVQ
jgi:hypothetical protein